MKRCGFCGYPLDDDCNPIQTDDANKLSESELNALELDYGNCCPPEQEENRIIQITRDMASDAGDLLLEGQWTEW